MRPFLLVPALLLSGGCIVIDELECRHQEERSAVVPVPAGLSSVEIRARAGSLLVRGQADASEVRVAGIACARRLRDRDGIQLEARAEGSRVVVEAIMTEAAARRGGRLNLTIDLPASARVEIEDSSGDIEIDGVASVDIDDDSGDLLVQRVAGEVTIHDDSGDILVDGAGAVRIDDDSGDITIERVAAVTIEDDSGDIELLDIAGDVTIVDDGSGDIEILDVGGNLLVEEDGTGDIDYAGVKGSIDVPRDERSSRRERDRDRDRDRD
jgi:hypothetical protein